MKWKDIVNEMKKKTKVNEMKDIDRKRPDRLPNSLALQTTRVLILVL